MIQVLEIKRQNIEAEDMHWRDKAGREELDMDPDRYWPCES